VRKEEKKVGRETGTIYVGEKKYKGLITRVHLCNKMKSGG